MRWLLFIAAGCIQLAAQGVTLGFASDPCSGGAVWTIDDARASIPTLRYGAAFDCTLKAATPQIVILDFVEPNATGPSQRIFDVSVNGQVSLGGVDLYAAGATGVNRPVSLPVLATPTWAGVITVSLKARVIAGSTHNSAVLSRITLMPLGTVSTTGLQGPQGIAGPAGAQGIPGTPPALPFTITDTSVDFGSREIKAKALVTTGDGHTQIYLLSGDPPISTVIADVTYDAVLYLDKVDNKVKMLLKDGSVVALWTAP